MNKENDAFLLNIHLLGGVYKLILKMRRSIILILIVLSLTNSGFCQYLPKFRRLSQQDMMAAPMMMAQKAKETENYLDNLTKDILSLRKDTDDPVLDKYLSNAYKELCVYYQNDLANNQIIAQIKSKERDIREFLVDYSKQKNNDADSNNEDLKKKQTSNVLVGHNFLVKSICEIYDRPTYESSYRGTAKVGAYVQFVENFDALWCKVRFGAIEGYTVKSCLNLPK